MGKKRRKIHLGPKGGRYYLKNGKKHYLKKTSRASFGEERPSNLDPSEKLPYLVRRIILAMVVSRISDEPIDIYEWANEYGPPSVSYGRNRRKLEQATAEASKILNSWLHSIWSRLRPKEDPYDSFASLKERLEESLIGDSEKRSPFRRLPDASAIVERLRNAEIARLPPPRLGRVHASPQYVLQVPPAPRLAPRAPQRPPPRARLPPGNENIRGPPPIIRQPFHFNL